MKRLVDNIIKLDIHELNTFNFPKNEFFGLEIIKDDVKYEFLIKFSTESEKLICFGSGAVSRKGPEAIDPPVFNRYSWNKEFKESLIYYNDPTR